MHQGNEWFFELVKVLCFITDVDTGDACTVVESASNSTLQQQPTQQPKFFYLPATELASSIHKTVKRSLSPIVDELLRKAVNASVVDRVVSAVVANNDYATLTSLRKYVADVANHTGTAIATLDQKLAAELQDRVEFRNSSLCQNVLGIPCNSSQQALLSEPNVGSTWQQTIQSLSTLGVPLNFTQELEKIGCALEVVDIGHLISESRGTVLALATFFSLDDLHVTGVSQISCIGPCCCRE